MKPGLALSRFRQPKDALAGDLHIDIGFVVLPGVLEGDGCAKQPLHLDVQAGSVAALPSPCAWIQPNLTHKGVETMSDRSMDTIQKELAALS